MLFIYGQAAVGKTTILVEYLDIIKAKYAYVNCIECYTNRLLHESILTQIFGVSSDIKCDNFMDLIHIFRNASKEGSFFNQPTAIVCKTYININWFISWYLICRFILIVLLQVLDGIENLNDSTSGNSLAVFSKLQEMTSIYSLSVIFISKVLPEKFYIDSSYIPVYFPQYTRGINCFNLFNFFFLSPSHINININLIFR